LFKAFGTAGRAGNGGSIAKRRNAAKSLERRAIRERVKSATVALRPSPIVQILPSQRALQRRFFAGSEII